MNKNKDGFYRLAGRGRKMERHLLRGESRDEHCIMEGEIIKKEGAGGLWEACSLFTVCS